ncbi:MAG: glycoside hydrolase family 27 protein [Bacteroidales bacterium]|nr:glycoside hydrolase family 27 protein [Bacteroidales bacterium]
MLHSAKGQSVSVEPGVFKTWALTPPMGWNSWDCYGPTVMEHEVKANADYMAQHLKPFGWEYIVVDIRWYVENDKAGGYNQTDPRYVIDEYGRYQPAVNRFPSAANGKGFKALADYVHGKGLKFGIHMMRGIPKIAVEQKLPVKGTNGITADQLYSTELQCPWLRDNYTIVADKPGAQEYYNSLFELYASWGVDFIKIDDLSRPYHKSEIELIRNAIDRCGRPILLSTSPGETPVEFAEHVRNHANMWRMVDDVWDTWEHFTHLMEVCQRWYPYIAPGTWPDCDMIPLGRISIRGERGNDRMTRLTRDEQYSLMTLFTIFRSPLFFGGDLPSNDAFTLSLLTNAEVMKMHRESAAVRQLFQDEEKVAIASKNAVSGEVYLAVFNMRNESDPIMISIDAMDLGINGPFNAFDMWNGKDAGMFSKKLSVSLRPHSCILYKLKTVD